MQNFYYQNYDTQHYLNLKFSSRKEIKKWGLACGVAVIEYIVLNTALSLFVGAIPSLYEIYLESEAAKGAIEIIISIISIFLPFLFLAIISKEKVFEKINFSKPRAERNTLLVILIGFAGCMIANYVATWLSTLLFGLGLSPDLGTAEIPLEFTFLGFFLSMLRTAVIPALIEEFAVRGVIMQPLRRFGDTFAIILSSFVFALMHGALVQGVFAFLVGLVIGYAVTVTGSIWIGVIIHFFNNFISIIISQVSVISVTASNITYQIINAAAIIAGICAIVIYLVKGEHYKLYNPVTNLSSGEKFIAFIANPTMIIAIALLAVNFVSSVV